MTEQQEKAMTKKRESFVFYRSFAEAIEELPDDGKGRIFQAICKYALDRIDPDLHGVELGYWKLIKPQLDANHRKYINGLKPKKEAKRKQNVSKTQANVNENVNENVNDILEQPPSSAEKEMPESEKEYAWTGAIIRLTMEDYDKWEKQFKRVNLDEELRRLDEYYTKHPPPNNKWFFPVFHQLKRKEKQAYKKLYGAQL